MSRLSSIVLVDDSEADNFLHRRTADLSGLVGEVVAFRDGRDAIEHLRTCRTRPDVVFLDLNMPTMTGWEFLDTYTELPIPARALFLLSTSPNPADRDRAMAHPLVDGFYPKPLTNEVLAEAADVVDAR